MLNIKDLISKTKKDVYQVGNETPIDILELFLEKASDAYYNQPEPIITDEEFDILLDFLKERNPKAPFLKQVGAPVGKNKVKLDYFLGSMDKIKPPSNKLENWLKKYPSPFLLSDKLDGISALLIYQDNKTKLFTRGTATEGMDISKLLKYLKYPNYEKINQQLSQLKIQGKKNLLAVRGELVMSKETFEKKYQNEFKNPRNLVSGIVNSKTLNPKIAPDLDLVIYEIVDPFMEFDKQFELIKKLGFNTVFHQKEKELSYEILNQVLKNRKQNSKYQVDGIIVTNTQLHQRSQEKNPEYAFAFKDLLEDQTRVVKVIDVEWNVSKSGILNPVVIIEPTELSGVTISRVTAFNAKYIQENKIGKNSLIEITRSGDVIPYILKVIKATIPLMPEVDYEWTNTKVDIYITEENEEQEIKKIYFFFKTLDTQGFGLKLIEKMYQHGFNTIEKILTMKETDFLTLPNVKEKSAENFFEELSKLRNKSIKLEDFILATNALGENFGSRKAKSLLENLPKFLTEKPKKEEIIKIEGFEEKTANLILENYQNFVKIYQKLDKYLNIEKQIKKQSKKSDLKYQNWVLSGFRDKEIQEKIESLGGKVSDSVTSNTDILVVKDESILENPTGKVQKALEKGIKIITKNQVNSFI
jgi:NAD-dependent DNA ligase